MEKVKLSDIPDYLRDGELYMSMLENSEDPNEVLTFDRTVLKKNTKVKSARDCDHLLNSLRFWGVNKFCEAIVAFVLIGPSEENDQVLAKYEQQFPYARALRMIKKSNWKTDKEKKQLCAAIETGCIQIVEYLLKGKELLPRLDACWLAARAGHVEMLEFVHQRGYVLNATSVAYAAVLHGHIECLEYARRNGAARLDYLLLEAACIDNIACMQYLHDIGCRWPEKVPYFAAKNGNLACLQYAHENGCPWDESTCHIAAGTGHFACLQYAMENGCTATADTCRGAASGGQLKCLTWLHEQGCPWDERTCEAAAKNGNLECLKYAHEQGCPWSETTCRAAARSGQLSSRTRMRMAVRGMSSPARLPPKVVLYTVSSMHTRTAASGTRMLLLLR